jgi:4a-hydroxytetrahydrobiopterin dehydratase
VSSYPNASSPVIRVEICIDCVDIDRVRPFWMAVLDYEPDPHDARGVVDPAGVRPSLWFQVVPEVKTVKNRVHLDPYFGDQDAAELRRDKLVALGGTAVARHHDFWLMRDPEGNEFCLCWPAREQFQRDGA